ncbi:hypothetical protein [Marinobacter daqiaonensis]|uniref:hypothetical protein n=1 Tax=Marinobacter daqiaonensis TaxID=650891 RepID=UPI000B8417E3|nr:hypothetical protein [Marinobacter daqiaonensis]
MRTLHTYELKKIKMGFQWFCGIIFYVYSSFALGSSCEMVDTKIAKLAHSNISDNELGRNVKEILFEEEKTIPKSLLSEVKSRAKRKAGGDSEHQQALLAEPFMFALMICRENRQISYQEAFKQAWNLLKKHDENQD